MNKEIALTEETKNLFVFLAKDSVNWNGTPMVDISPEQRGNLTALKKNQLIETFKDDGINWANFTDKGKAYAESLGYPITEW